MVRRLHDPADRAKIKTAIIASIQNGRAGGNPKNVVMASCSFDASLAGKSLAQIIDERGKTPSAENAAEGGCSAVYYAIDEQDVERILRYPFTMIGSEGEISLPGQGVPHPRGYGTFARVLARYVRERRIGRHILSCTGTRWNFGMCL